MKAHAHCFSVEKMASLLSVTRSGYYAFLKRGISSREKANQKLCTKILHIQEESNETYGSPRIHAELKERCSRKRVARLMRLSGIAASLEAPKLTRWRDPSF